MAALIAGALIGFGPRAFGIHPVHILTGSMSPTVKPGNWVVVKDRDRSSADDYHRGEIVSFRFPLATKGRAIKRVVAVAGDTVDIARRSVTVSGHVIHIRPRPYDPAALLPPGATPVPSHYAIHKGQVFLLGDNAPISIDSRNIGPLPNSEIVGRVLFVVPGAAWLVGTAVALVALIAGLALLIGKRRQGQKVRRSRTRRRGAPSSST